MNKSVSMSPRTPWTAITNLPGSVGGRIGKISLLCLIVAVLLAASMGTMTYRFAGGAGLVAMGAALFISLVSNVAGALPACWSLGGTEAPDAKAMLSGMLVRMVVLLLLAVPATMSDVFPRQPLLLWLAGGYFALLMTETSVVANWIGQHQRRQES